ncbi:hypothetical protein VSDG_00579 [Cytospora chrysosperma]|uniref:Integral membrane protein n=1 Tax=Cytospora chrysosperma TaxID=252740 RepID=A0A423WNR6_CYTCH|nr:hypothetical protein VSDG_00579 [Valsa sordida]
MASNPDAGRQDENPYFDPDVTHQTPDLASSTSISQMSTRAPEPNTPTRERPPALSRPGPTNNASLATNRQQSSIGLRRLRAQPSRNDAALDPTGRQQQQQQQAQQLQNVHSQGDAQAESSRAADNRRRSSSEPQRPTWLADPNEARNTLRHLPSVPEMSETKPDMTQQKSAGRRGSLLFRTRTKKQPQPPQTAEEAEYDSRIVDFLDVVDPEVSTLTSITNVQNSLFIPSLGRWVNRRPTYDISEIQRPMPGRYPDSLANIAEEAQRTRTQGEERPNSDRAYSISSKLEDSHYAVLPHGETLDGWRKEDVDRLNDHVRHMLHSRRSKFKRSLKGFGRYVSRPLGFFVTLYATLITLFGLAWVLFLIGWIYVGTKQLYVINIIDYILVALFAIMGDGLAPFRVVDTYHMIYIAHYHRLSWKLRKKLLLPDLRDHNDLPEEPVLPDIEAAAANEELASFEADTEFSVLSPKQQEVLIHHQTKYAKSHTFYKPHETETHFAFPLRLMITITCLLDLHSCLQISLGACTWGIPYKTRPAALTTVILCCSITVNATAGLLIWIGDRRTRKKDVIERMTRQELTEEAMHKVQKHNQKEAEKAERVSGEEHGEGEGGWGQGISLPQISIDKFRKTGDRKRDVSPPEP